MNLRLVVALLFCCTVRCHAQDLERYKNFEFELVYPEVTTVDQSSVDVLSNFKKLEWHKINNYHEIDAGNVWVVYGLNIEKSDLENYAAYRDKAQYLDNRKLEDWERRRWEAVGFFDEKGEFESLEINNAPDSSSKFWPVGTFFGSSYGCIYKEPIFKSKLIEGRPDFVFVVSSLKDHSGLNHSGGSFIRLQLFDGKNGTQQFEEYPMLWSVETIRTPKKPDSEFIADFDYKYVMNDPRYWLLYGVDWEGFFVDFNTIKATQNTLKQEKAIPGRYEYAKMFVNDLDKDGLLEILFWHKRYVYSNFDIESIEMEKEFFTLYKENEIKSFVRVGVTNNLARKLLLSNGLSWNNGWPNDDNLCDEDDLKDPNIKQTRLNGLTEDKLITKPIYYGG